MELFDKLEEKCHCDVLSFVDGHFRGALPDVDISLFWGVRA